MNQHKTGLNGAVADVLRGRLKRDGLTQVDLANRSGLPLVSVQRYLTAARPIDIEVLDKLARALGSSPTAVLVEAAQVLVERS